MDTTLRAPGTLSLTLLFLYAGCEPPPPLLAPSHEESEADIDAMH